MWTKLMYEVKGYDERRMIDAGDLKRGMRTGSLSRRCLEGSDIIITSYETLSPTLVIRQYFLGFLH